MCDFYESRLMDLPHFDAKGQIKVANLRMTRAFRSKSQGTGVDNFRCTWTLFSTQSGDGWPQRSQLQPGVPSLGRCVTLLRATF